MQLLFKGMKRKLGVVIALLAVVTSCGWVKSHYTQGVICIPNGDGQPDKCSLAGKIGIFLSSHHFYRDQMISGCQLSVDGLLVESLELTVPNHAGAQEVDSQPPRIAVSFDFEISPGEVSPSDGQIQQVSFEVEADNQNSDELRETTSMPPALLDEYQSTLDQNRIESSKWERVGVYLNLSKSPRMQSWNISLLIPHAYLTIPMALLSFFLVRGKAGRAEHPAKSLTVSSQ
jgi:hypothetical protein